MDRKYTFSEKDIEIIREARRKNKDKRVKARLKALQMRAEGKTSKEASSNRFSFSLYKSTYSKIL